MEIDIQAFVAGAPAPRRVRDLVGRIRRLVRPATSRIQPSALELSILFCGDLRMQALNRRYRGMDRPTDVLAFPGSGRALGDIVISVPYAGREARRRGLARAREIDRLLLHGYLHLFGYDHEKDNGEMDALEARLARRLGLPSGEWPAARESQSRGRGRA